jgi:hypothetical protein
MPLLGIAAAGTMWIEAERLIDPTPSMQSPVFVSDNKTAC